MRPLGRQWPGVRRRGGQRLAQVGLDRRRAGSAGDAGASVLSVTPVPSVACRRRPSVGMALGAGERVDGGIQDGGALGVEDEPVGAHPGRAGGLVQGPGGSTAGLEVLGSCSGRQGSRRIAMASSFSVRWGALAMRMAVSAASWEVGDAGWRRGSGRAGRPCGATPRRTRRPRRGRRAGVSSQAVATACRVAAWPVLMPGAAGWPSPPGPGPARAQAPGTGLDHDGDLLGLGGAAHFVQDVEGGADLRVGQGPQAAGLAGRRREPGRGRPGRGQHGPRTEARGAGAGVDMNPT